MVRDYARGDDQTVAISLVDLAPVSRDAPEALMSEARAAGHLRCSHPGSRGAWLPLK